MPIALCRASLRLRSKRVLPSLGERPLLVKSSWEAGSAGEGRQVELPIALSYAMSWERDHLT